MHEGWAAFLESRDDEPIPIGFALVAPFGAVVFCAAVALLFVKRLRGGIVRALLAAGAGALAIAGIVYTKSVSPPLLVIAYCLPAALNLPAARILECSPLPASRAL